MDEVKRRRREFIWAHHPDRGGDPAAFIAGLRRLDEEAGLLGLEPRAQVLVVAHRAWPVRLLAALARLVPSDVSVPRVR